MKLRQRLLGTDAREFVAAKTKTKKKKNGQGVESRSMVQWCKSLGIAERWVLVHVRLGPMVVVWSKGWNWGWNMEKAKEKRNRKRREPREGSRTWKMMTDDEWCG